MPGFNISIGKLKFTNQYVDSCNLVCDSITNNRFSIQKFTLRKFENDKIFVDQPQYTLVLEGVILNKQSLIRPGLSWQESVIILYREIGDSFFSEFRGSFSGALYDKKTDKWIIFTDHIGSKHVYYTRIGEEIYLSSEIVDLYELFKRSNIDYSLDHQGAYMLLSYGYMLEDFTLCSQIKKLKAGSFIKIDQGGFSICEYYRLPEIHDENVLEEDAVEQIDQLFRKAIALQFEKDKEYGYKHFVALSGGLDSRMTSLVAHDLGYIEQLNFTFSQSGYLDETIAKKIASDLKHEWIFKALDNGLFLKDIDSIALISGGNALYYGLAHGNSALKFINFNTLGVLHSGQLGDVIIGSYGQGDPNDRSKPYSKVLISKVNVLIPEFYKTLELKNIYQRGFNGINTGLLPAQKYTETLSPFYDVDLMDYCLKLPIDLRVNHGVYKKWVLNKYPQAANYIWETTNDKLTATVFSIRGKEFTFKKLQKTIFYKLGLSKSATETPFHMNPLGYWYKTNLELKKFQDTYFEENIEGLNDYPLVLKDCKKLYSNGSAMEKNQVLTLLSAMKLFFNI